MRAMIRGIWPQLLRPDTFRWETSAGIPASRALWNSSFSASSMRTPSFRMCDAYMPPRRRAVRLSHHGEAHLGRAHEGGDVERRALLRQLREISVQIAPVLAIVPFLHGIRVVQDELIGQRGYGAPLARDLGRDPLGDLREHAVVDERVDLGLAHHVDEARGDDQPGHVQGLACLGSAQEPHGSDAITADGDVPAVARIAAAVHDPAVLEKQIVAAVLVSRFPFPAGSDDRCSHEGQSYLVHVLLSESGLTMRPRIMTNAMRRVAAMSAAGLASSTTRSATLPGVSIPSESARNSSAPLRVAAVMASTGVNPAPTRRLISSCSDRPGTSSWFAASEPAATSPPARLNSRTNWFWRARDRRNACRSPARQPLRRSRPATSRTLVAVAGTSSMPGRDSSVGLSRRESISCSTSVGTIPTWVAASPRATPSSAAESSSAHPSSSSVQPRRNSSCARR